jgi:RimJ/RimL family protein N-acetyltransferase
MLAHPTDFELLRIQAEGSFDGAGRVSGMHGIEVVCTAEGQSLWIGADLPETLVAELLAMFEGAAPSRHPAEPPAALEPCRRLLETGGRSLRCEGSPRFVFPENTQFESPAHIERSDTSNLQALRGANPGNWHPVEWDELLAGQLGPWAMAIEDEAVVSICHTPGPVRPRAAEAGVWTHPAFRGRGYGAAVTAEWAAVMRSPGRFLFYSTDATNLSSQRLAQRLGLRPLGWIWTLAPAPDQPADRVHPLSSVHRPR